MNENNLFLRYTLKVLMMGGLRQEDEMSVSPGYLAWAPEIQKIREARRGRLGHEKRGEREKWVKSGACCIQGACETFIFSDFSMVCCF